MPTRRRGSSGDSTAPISASEKSRCTRGVSGSSSRRSRGSKAVSRSLRTSHSSARRLIPADQAPKRSQHQWMRKDEPQREGANKCALRCLQNPGPLDVRPRVLKHQRVIDPRRARRLAGQAAEAKVEFFPKRFCHREVAFRDVAHQRDPPARAVPLKLCRVVSRTRRQAHAAVNALLEHREIEVREVVRLCGLSQKSSLGSGCRRDRATASIASTERDSHPRWPPAKTSSSPIRRHARR
jgi:hypothetical protein